MTLWYKDFCNFLMESNGIKKLLAIQDGLVENSRKLTYILTVGCVN